ncbi:hypothetical protein OUZ56_027050 [Daphnia magna]|uniref:Uncharacterized protein n=1 Tax=Daphnia magna TaxID=35525 RepID=A0ABQ9ZNL5_9CRUS|nr:hypothetical protein OUZ56_027050 [Daphnia magna]
MQIAASVKDQRRRQQHLPSSTHSHTGDGVLKRTIHSNRTDWNVHRVPLVEWTRHRKLTGTKWDLANNSVVL